MFLENDPIADFFLFSKKDNTDDISIGSAELAPRTSLQPVIPRTAERNNDGYLDTSPETSDARMADSLCSIQAVEISPEL